MTEKYMRDRASRIYNSRGMRMMDSRNPYGSRGGYVSSRKMRNRMDMGNYYSEHDNRYGRGYDRGQYPSDYHYGSEYYGEHSRPMEYEMFGYGVGGMYPRHDMRYDRGYDYASEDMEKEWKEDLHEWCEKLKKHDKFKLPKEQVLHSAKQMNIMFNDYNEEEFLTTYYMMMSDYPDIATNHQTYIAMAKDFLHDEDSELKGSDKLCAYYYEVVKAGKE